MDSLINFLNNALDHFQVVKHIENSLKEKGFLELNEKKSWNLDQDKNYYVKREDSSLIAFSLKDLEKGLLLSAAHTDSPCLKLKIESERIDSNLSIVTTDVYGGLIRSSYVNRELNVSGRVYYKKDNELKKELIILDLKMIIPDLAIHLNREINNGISYNPQQHMNAIILKDAGENLILNEIASKLNINIDNIIYTELFLSVNAKASLYQNMISSAKLDNVAGCSAVLDAFLASLNNGQKSKFALFFDNEEIGSNTFQGADGSFITDVINRIFPEKYQYTSKLNSYFISVDGGHAVHPSYKDKHDPSYSPNINKGFSLKLSTSYKYSQQSETVAKILDLCIKNNIAYQKQINRSDLPSGSTIGNMLSAKTGMSGVDLGIPMLAMHSSRELAGIIDHKNVINLLKEFYNSFD